ncbi:hypothetical protein CDAR_524931 [Caerostris darwini]|uniref:Uncharacterized protein n=1 Tax=Caerostris darwini TaxID=1538125 RepID=A0AAV4R0I9_9ARAC|nr:hypothetical protein CDAR_524931 [Caerostris darwini]
MILSTNFMIQATHLSGMGHHCILLLQRVSVRWPSTIAGHLVHPFCKFPLTGCPMQQVSPNSPREGYLLQEHLVFLECPQAYLRIMPSFQQEHVSMQYLLSFIHPLCPLNLLDAHFTP